MENPLVFKLKTARQKPSNKDICPFCTPSYLTQIIDQTDEFIFLDNKYPTLEATYQTLIIESHEHLGDIFTYSRAYNRRLFAYALSKWQDMMADERFKSVLLYKNFGPLSGGSLRHPHMQIVGLETLDGYEQVSSQHFIGDVLLDAKGEINISSYPIMGFTEFNVCIKEWSQLDALADGVQDVVAYIMNRYMDGRCDSYNLFFYPNNAGLVCKVVPRFIASPYFIGYGLTQVNDKETLQYLKNDFLDFIKNN